MKKNEYFKRVIDDNIADKESILQNTLSNYMEDKSYRANNKSRVPYRLATGFLAFTLVVGYSLIDIKSPKEPKSANNMTSSQGKVSKNNFKIFAYAAEKKGNANDNNSKIDENRKIELKVNKENEVPYGKIVQGKPTSYTNNKGEEIKGHEVNFDSNLQLICNGEKIKSITYTSVNGELSYFDFDLARKMHDNGEVFVCKIEFPNSKVGTDLSLDNVIKAFVRMWKAGEFDEYKNKYFGGKDVDVENYSDGIRCGSNALTGKSYVAFCKPQKGDIPYYQKGTMIKINPLREEIILDWSPIKAMDILAKEGVCNNYEELPSDTITAEVEFQDGQVIRKTINLSFNKEGKLVIEVKE